MYFYWMYDRFVIHSQLLIPGKETAAIPVAVEGSLKSDVTLDADKIFLAFRHTL